MRPSALTACASYPALQSHANSAKDWSMRALFAADPQRFDDFSLHAAGLFLDYSKNRLQRDTLQLLLAATAECGLIERRDAMFAGEKINLTEHRAVLHTALRAPATSALQVDGQNITHDVHAVLERMHVFTERVRSGAWRGHGGQMITDVVNIGIGGSDLGPKMAVLALRSLGHPRLQMHFVSNADGHDLDAVLSKVDPATTLFIVASKTFTTMETMLNAHSARNWFLQHATADGLPHHFVAVSTNTEAIKAFGIDPENMFPFWDWVGGRYSIWSAIGLPLALAVGFEHFSQFLAGAHAMDRHFQSAPLAQNMPVLLALTGVWNRDFLDYGTLSIAAYHQDLNRFPAYLQQLEMESNGKRVTHGGALVTAPTSPVIWGDCGTNGQHAYFQMLHQGTDIIPLDFIACLRPSHHLPGHQAALLANCFAQSEALMRGKSAEEVHADLQAQGMAAAEIEMLMPHKTFPGNRPSNTILLQELDAAALGALIALYEHKVFVQGVLWDVNSFDQWGVELGKVLAQKITAELTGAAHPEQHDCSTNGLIGMAKAVL